MMCFLEDVRNSTFQNWLTCLRAKKRLAAQITPYALRNRQGKQAFAKENEKKHV